MFTLENVQIDNPFHGIHIYRNTLPIDLDLVNRLEKTIEENQDDWFTWSEALVGDYQKMPEYRDCVDFKVRKIDIEQKPKAAASDLKNIYNDIDERLQVCLADYCSRYNITMGYQEAVNFVRYKEGQHFQVHADHGFSYVCSVSTVMYLNGGYEGGGLWFPFINYTYEPQEGDIVLFPSNWLFSHAALPVKSGVKYSAVTMFDYNDRFHSPEYMQLMMKNSELYKQKQATMS